MPRPSIEVRGLKELQRRFKEFPGKFFEIVETFLQAALHVFWENVPPYPPKPTSSTYRRTGTLGRTLGSSESGGVGFGRPQIYETRQFGGFIQAHFGTRLGYAEPVIGETQAPFFAQYWWRLVEVIGPSYGKIRELAQITGQKLADFLKGKG